MTAHDRARRHSPTPHEDALVQRLEALGTQVATGPSAEHRAITRARLVAMAAVRPPAGAPDLPAVRSPRAPRLPRLLGGSVLRWRTRVTAGLTGAALTVGSLGGVLAVSQGATPGDVLYPVKRGGEQTQLALAGDASRGRTLLEFASTRLTELTELAGDPGTVQPAGGPATTGGTAVVAAGPDADVVVDVLATMDRQTTRGAREVAARSVASGDPAPLADLATWAAGQETGLAGLAGAVPEAAAPALAGATDLATAVAERARALVAALGCTTGPASVGVDDLGPRPAPCSPAASRTATRDTADPRAAAAVTTGAVTAEPSAGPTGADTAGAAPAPAGASAAPGPAAAPPGAGSAAATPAGSRSGGAPAVERKGGAAAPAGGPPARGDLPVPVPTPRGPAPTQAPARPSAPPVVDVPLPLCVTALGLPVLC